MTLRRALVALAVAVMLAHCWWYRDFTVDDGAISFSYARSLAHGHGLVLVPGGEHVEGYTNFLWVVLLAVGIRLGIDVVVWSHLLGAALAVATVVGVAELMAALRGRHSAWDAAPALLCALLLTVPYWAMSGLEGGLYAASVVWCAARLCAEARDPSLRPLSAVLAAAAALTRPDALAIVAIACVARPFADRAPRRLLTWYALALAPIGLHELWRYAYYAYPAPNTFYAKVDEPFHLRELHDWTRVGWRYTDDLVEHLKLMPLAWAALLALVPGRRWTARAAVVAMLASIVAFVVYANGDWMAEGRFYVAAVPLLVALAGGGIALVCDLARPRPVRLALAVTATVALGVALVPNAIAATRARRHHYPVPMEVTAGRGRWYREFADRYHVAHPSALDGDMGGTSWFSRMPIVDLGGLTDVTIARWKRDPSAFREYVHGERRPTVMKLVAFWLSEVNPQVPEFVERYIQARDPASREASDGIYVDRDVFTEPAMDTRAPLARFARGGVDLLRVEADRNVRLWLLVRGDGASLVLHGSQTIAVEHPMLERARWRAGDIMKLELPRPAGALTLCDADTCRPIGDGAAGAAPVALPASTAALARAETRGELEAALSLRQRLKLPTSALADRFYARALAARRAGDDGRAFRDFLATLAADPGRAWARRHAEELRQAPRPVYRWIFHSRLQQALRALRLQPDATTMARVALLARQAGEDETAALAFATFRVAPDAADARQALARALRRTGRDDEATAIAPTAPPPPTLGDVARDLALVGAQAALDGAGRVRLSLALVARGPGAPAAIAVDGRAVPFDRPPSAWAPGEVYVHAVTLDLPAGESRVAVGMRQLRVDVTPFSADFERGSFDGWTVDGDAFGSGPLRWPMALPMRASEGLFYVSSVYGASGLGRLSSPPLADGVDEVCFVYAARGTAGVRIGSATTPTTDDAPRPHCLPARAGERIEIFDDGAGTTSKIIADDFACFAGGAPVACAGRARVLP